MRKLEDSTLNLITNPTLLEINSYSSDNREACEIFYPELLIISIFDSRNVNILFCTVPLYYEYKWSADLAIKKFVRYRYPRNTDFCSH